MALSSTLSWLVYTAAYSTGADRFLAELGAHLLAGGLPLAGGALTLDIPHPLIARRTWLWRGDSGEVIEALGFAPGGPAAAPAANTPNDAGRRWLAGIAAGPLHQDTTSSGRNGAFLRWAGPPPFMPGQTNRTPQPPPLSPAPLS